MIKTNEVRVRNLIYYSSLPGIFVEQQAGVVEIIDSHNSCIWVEGKDDPFGLENIAGIPLTTEWLEKIGFIKDRGGWHLAGTQFSLTEQLYPCWLDRMLWPQDIQDFRQTSLVYVHRLQNLYFTLTGEELNVRL